MRMQTILSLIVLAALAAGGIGGNPFGSASLPSVRKVPVTVAGPRCSTQPRAICCQERAVASVKVKASC